MGGKEDEKSITDLMIVFSVFGSAGNAFAEYHCYYESQDEWVDEWVTDSYDVWVDYWEDGYYDDNGSWVVTDSGGGYYETVYYEYYSGHYETVYYEVCVDD